MNSGGNSKYLSNRRQKKPIIVPFIGAITSVPQPIPSKRLKNASDIIAAAARQDKSKQVLKCGNFMPNFPLTPLTKKS